MNAMSRDEFILANMGLVGMVARKYTRIIKINNTLEYEDLISIGSIGLIKAYDRFNPERGAQFSTYAVPFIWGEIQRFIRDHLYAIKFPRRAGQSLPQILEAGLENESPAAIAEKLGMPLKDAEAAIAFNNNKVPGYLSTILYKDEQTTFTLGDTIGEEMDMDTKVDFEQVIKQFDEQTQQVLRLRAQDLTQTQIAEIVGISQVSISRILKDAKEQLKQKLQVVA